MAKVYYAAGKGPFGTGESLSSRYVNLQKRVLDLVQRGTPEASASAQRLSDFMGNALARHTGAERVRNAVGGFQIMQRDIAPSDNQGTPILGNMSLAYSSGDMIGMELLPIAPVDLISGEYVTYPRRDRMQVVRGTGRGRRSDANEVPINEDTATYTTTSHTHKNYMALDSILAGRIAHRQAPVDRLVHMVDEVAFHHQLEHEAKAIEVLTNTSNFATDYKSTLTSGNHWDETSSDIAKAIDDANQVVWKGRGASDLVFATSLPVWNAIRRRTALVGLKSANDRGFFTMMEFADTFGFDGVLVSDLRLDNAALGQTEDPLFAWGNNALILRVSRTPQQRNACWGYTFRWNAGGGLPAGTNMASSNGLMTSLTFDPEYDPMGAFCFKMSDYWGINIVAADTGFLFSDVLNVFPS